MRRDINAILRYPENSAGSIMTTEYVSLRKAMTVGEAILRIRRTGIDKETIYTCYVTDNRTLIQFVSNLQELVLRFRYMFYETTESAANVAAEHGNICDAILAGDVEKTIAETRNHIQGLKEVVADFDF